VSISSTFFRALFSYKRPFWQLFKLRFGFGAKNSYEKGARRMLMKLTAGIYIESGDWDDFASDQGLML
jgi:hypothetical protein